MNLKIRILFFAFLSFASLTKAGNDTCLTVLNLGISFPPVADANQRAFAKLHLDNLGVNKIRIAEDWTFREPSPGTFNWTSLEDRLMWADSNNYEVLLTIQSRGPSWACSGIQNANSCVFNDNQDFRNYLDSLLIRYGDKISRIQFGNEWQTDFWYAGNAGQFIASNNVLFDAVQAHSPQTEVVLGGFTTISLRFMAGCNGYVSSFYDDDGILFDSTYLANNCNTPVIQSVKDRIDSVLSLARYDMLDIHLYDDVEQWDEYYLNFADTISKPIIVTEFGGPNLNYEPYTPTYQANRLFEYIKKLDSLQISDAYFFKLVQGTANTAHLTSGLIEDTNLTEKPAYFLFKSFIGCTTSVYEEDLPQGLRFYPNPLLHATTVEFDNPNAKPKELRIYNLHGQVIRHIQNIRENYVFIPRENLKSGQYIIHLSDSKEWKITGRLSVY